MQYKNNVGPKWVLRVLVYLLILFILPIMVGAKGTVAFARILEYTDNEYNYSFQFPSNWKTQKVTKINDNREIRVLLQGPRASSIMVLVDPLEKGITKEEFRKNPKKYRLVQQMIDYTVDHIYRKSSKRMNASKMIVVERQIRRSKVGIQFYISTLHVINGVPLGLAGLHAIPYGKNHIIGFVMSSILDSKTMENNLTFKRIFNSFRLVGDNPAPPPTLGGGVLEQVTSWVPVVGELNWRKSLDIPLIQNNVLFWLPLGLVCVLTFGLAKSLRRRHRWHSPAPAGKFH